MGELSDEWQELGNRFDGWGSCPLSSRLDTQKAALGATKDTETWRASGQRPAFLLLLGPAYHAPGLQLTP